MFILNLVKIYKLTFLEDVEFYKLKFYILMLLMWKKPHVMTFMGGETLSPSEYYLGRLYSIGLGYVSDFISDFFTPN